MVNMIAPLTLWQTGEESTRGTAVPATSKLLCPVDIDPEDAVFRPQHAVGIAFANPGQEFIVSRGTRVSIPDYPMNYQDQPIWQSMGTKGSVSGSNSLGVYTWTFTPSLTADPAYNSRTLERRLSDGSNSIDNEWAYFMLSRWGFKWAAGQPVMFNADGFARRIQSSTLTAALSAPTPENIPSALVVVKIDDAWASVGTTAISAQILSGELDYITGAQPFSASDGRTDLDFSGYDFNARLRKFTLKMRCLVKNSGQFATERTKAEGASLRAIQISMAGTSPNDFKFKGLFKHTPGSYQKVDEVDGQDVIDLELEQATDGTNCCSVVVVNSVADRS